MANIAQTGFESGDTSEGIGASGTFSVQGTITRGAWSAYAFRANPTTTGTGSVRIVGHLTTGAATNAGFSAATIFCRLYLRVNTLPATTDEEFLRLTLVNNSTLKFALRITSAGLIAAYDGTPTIITTGTAVLATGTWYRIEFKVGTGAGAVVEWKVATGDGAAITDISTTATLSATNSGGVTVGKTVNYNGNTVDFYYDDILVSNAAYPGPGRCKILVPNAAGNYQIWTRAGADSGANWSQVNEVPPNGDTNYLLSDLVATDAETESLTDSGTVAISGVVNCVKSYANVKRDGASNGSINYRLRSATTDSDGTAYASTSSYAGICHIFDTNPATGAAWAVAALDAIEAGAVNQSVGFQTRMTATYAMVDYTPSVVPMAAMHQFQQRRRRSS